MKTPYKSLQYEKEQESLKLTSVRAILKAVEDARIDLEGLQPEEVYQRVLDRINKSAHMTG